MKNKGKLLGTDQRVYDTILKRIETDGTTYEAEKKRITKAIKNPLDKAKMYYCFGRIEDWMDYVKQT